MVFTPNLRISLDCHALLFEFGYSILYFCLRALHARSLLIAKIVTTEFIVDHVYCVNPSGKYGRKICTCGQAHNFRIVQMTGHPFNEMSTVGHEPYNFLSPETINTVPSNRSISADIAEFVSRIENKCTQVYSNWSAYTFLLHSSLV
jgi:hypothetical protein